MIQLDVKDVEVNGVPYRLQKVPAGQAWPMALWIKEVAGAAQGAMVKGGDTDAVMTPMGQVAALGNAEAHMARMLRDPAFFAGVVKPLLAQCARLDDGIPKVVTFDGENAFYYGNRLEELLALYQAAVDFNFGPFLRAFSNPNAGGNGTQAGGKADPESP